MERELGVFIEKGEERAPAVFQGAQSDFMATNGADSYRGVMGERKQKK
jgi:hypothetical protein